MKAKSLTLLVGAVLLAGCQSSQYRSSYYGPAGDPQMGAIPQEKGFVDRHPLLSAPRNYYRDSGDNPVVKVFAGTFVGVPVGVAREVGQIVYGQ
jgi:hypothetical protein